MLAINSSINLSFPEHAKILGLTSDERLKWKLHTDQIIAKLQREKWALRNLVKIVDGRIAQIFYHSIIISHIRYSLIVWGASQHASDVLIEQKKPYVFSSISLTTIRVEIYSEKINY